MEEFLELFELALRSISEPRLFQTERGYQGRLLSELERRLPALHLPGHPLVEQEYQKTLPHHRLTIRPDIIIHIPFERNTTQSRAAGNFVAVEMKRRAKPADADEDFGSLAAIKEKLGYPITIFLNIDSAETHANRCPESIANQTVCFAVQLRDGVPTVSKARCAELRV